MDEAAPLWVPIDAVPFDQMWADGANWFPHLLSGQPFHGRFLFEGDKLLGYEVVLVDETLVRGD
jgi:8-oxo-dGTP diphosphatase